MKSNRWLTVVQTDREIYRPGDTLFFRLYYVNALDNSIASISNNRISFEIESPSGQNVHSSTFPSITFIPESAIHIRNADGKYLALDNTNTLSLQSSQSDNTLWKYTADGHLIHQATSLCLEAQFEKVKVTPIRWNYRPQQWELAEDRIMSKVSGNKLEHDEQYGFRLLWTSRQWTFGDVQIYSSSWDIPKEIEGGEYKLKVKGNSYLKLVGGERKLSIRNYRNPQMNIDIEFIERGYRANDTVLALVKVKRAEGGVPVGSTLSATATIGTETIFSQEYQVQPNGNYIQFKLPESIESTEGLLYIVVSDEGYTESKSQTIPLVDKEIILSFYGESGALVAGLNNTVYFEALSVKSKDPLDSFVGELCILDNDNKCESVVTTVKAHHEGRGRFEFVPLINRRYGVKVVKPSDISNIYQLPKIANTGILLHSIKDVYNTLDPIQFSVTTTLTSVNNDLFNVKLYKREEEIANATLTFQSKGNISESTVILTPPESKYGVLRATLFYKNIPIAERLLFRDTPQKLNIEIKTLQNSLEYTPGSSVTVHIKTTNQNGSPIPAILGITVTDETVLNMVDKRKRVPSLPSLVLLENEVNRFENADQFLTNNVNIDLLLGTQGWRRFIYLKPSKFLETNKTVAERLFVYSPLVDHFHYKNFAFGAGAGMEFGIAEATGLRRARQVLQDVDPTDKIAFREAALKFHPDKSPAVEEAYIFVALDEAEVTSSPPAVDDSLLTEEFIELEQIISGYQQLTEKRIYAHKRKARKDNNARADFTQTVYWAGGLVTDPVTGEVQFSFDLSESITTFRILVDGVAQGQNFFGAGETKVVSVKPFFVDVKVPLECTDGDLIKVPIKTVNYGKSSRNVKIHSISHGEGLSLLHPSHSDLQFDLEGGSRSTNYLELEATYTNVSSNPGIMLVTTATDADGSIESDKLLRKIQVTSPGFPITISDSNILDSSTKYHTTISLPNDIVPNSLQTSFNLYVTPTATLTAALESLLREPYGCFEQTSATVYPLIMAQQYFKSHTGIDPSFVARAHTLIEQGYKRLTSFETSSLGFEWFGSSPGHEALSAYGLLEFTDMAKVFPVEQTVLDRTRDWILDQRESNGFKRNSKQIDSFGAAPDDITNAYIVYSLTSAGISKDKLISQLESLSQQAKSSNDPYFIGLVAGSLYNIGDTEHADELATKLTKWQKPEGKVEGASTSITRSFGDSLLMETTSIATLVWLQSPKFSANAHKAVEWIATQCKDGKFGSTQATVLALKAIIEYDSKRSAVVSPGTVSLFVDDQFVSSISFTSNATNALKLPDFSHKLQKGKTHSISLEMEGGCPLPFSIQLSMNALTPKSCPKNDNCELPITLSTSLIKETLVQGEVTQIVTKVKNNKKDPVPMTIAIVGVPGGMEIRYDKLTEMVKSGEISFFEVKNREVILYWRGLDANAEITLHLDVTAVLPGHYTGPASRAYLYYTDELKDWKQGLTTTILE